MRAVDPGAPASNVSVRRARLMIVNSQNLKEFWDFTSIYSWRFGRRSTWFCEHSGACRLGFWGFFSDLFLPGWSGAGELHSCLLLRESPLKANFVSLIYMISNLFLAEVFFRLWFTRFGIAPPPQQNLYSDALPHHHLSSHHSSLFLYQPVVFSFALLLRPSFTMHLIRFYRASSSSRVIHESLYGLSVSSPAMAWPRESWPSQTTRLRCSFLFCLGFYKVFSRLSR